MKRRMSLVSVLCIVLYFLSNAAEPNYQKTTVLKVGKKGDGTDADLVTKSYTDGLGRGVQSKLLLNNKDRVSCSFFDEIGRQKYATKVFIDEINPGLFLNGDFSVINADGSPLRVQYAPYDGADPDDDPNAYSEIEYYADPLERAKEAASPGEEFRIGEHTVKFWYYSVARADASVNVTSGEIFFKNGFISSIVPRSPSTESDVLDDLYTKLLNTQPLGVPTHSLKVTKGADDEIVQEMSDINGQLVAVRVDPDNAISGDEIISEYQYDILGRLLREIAPKKAPESGSPQTLIADAVYEYNPLGQLEKKTSPDGAEMRFEYNDAGLLLYARMYKSGNCIREIYTTYDKFSRDVAIYLCQPPLAGRVLKEKVKKVYDSYNDLLGKERQYMIPVGFLQNLKNLKGRLAAVIASNTVDGRDFFVTELYSYDEEGRTSLKYKIIPGYPVQKTGVKYDLQGKIDEDTFSCGTENIIKKYHYDELGNLKSIEHVDNSNATLVEYNYTEKGQLESKNFSIGAGFEVGFDYTINEWLASIQSPAIKGFYETVNYTGLYSGNIKRTDYRYKGALSEETYDQTYFYDKTSRLKAVTSGKTGFGAAFNYDVVGRFSSKLEGSSNNDLYEYYSTTSRLKKAKTGGSEYIYDEFGNCVVDLAKKMVVEYDWRDMPVRFRFYDAIPVLASKIWIDSRGSYTINDAACTGCDLYSYLDYCVKNSSIQLLSTVTMMYDAAGNRVYKTTEGN